MQKVPRGKPREKENTNRHTMLRPVGSSKCLSGTMVSEVVTSVNGGGARRGSTSCWRSKGGEAEGKKKIKTISKETLGIKKWVKKARGTAKITTSNGSRNINAQQGSKGGILRELQDGRIRRLRWGKDKELESLTGQFRMTQKPISYLKKVGRRREKSIIKSKGKLDQCCLQRRGRNVGKVGVNRS